MIKKQIIFESEKRNLPEELVRTLEFENSARYNNYNKVFEIFPKDYLLAIGKIFVKELEKTFKNAGYKIIPSSRGFYSFEPEKFVLEMNAGYYTTKDLQEGFKKRSDLTGLLFNLNVPIMKKIPMTANVNGKVISDEKDGFKDPAKIMNHLKDMSYDVHYDIIQKSKKTMINVDASPVYYSDFPY